MCVNVCTDTMALSRECVCVETHFVLLCVCVNICIITCVHVHVNVCTDAFVLSRVCVQVCKRVQTHLYHHVRKRV